MTLDLEGLDRHLETRLLARTLEVWSSLGSTNDRAKIWAKRGAAHGLAVYARTQTQGRGQRGRSWSSPPDLGLYVSFLIRPQLSVRAAQLLPLLGGLAVHRAIQRVTGIETRLKWPNDVLAANEAHYGQKLAGVLVEMSASANAVEHAIMGFGINVREGVWPPELAAYAGSLERSLLNMSSPSASDLNARLAIAPLLAALAASLEGLLDEAEAHGMGSISQEVSERMAGLDEEVTLDVDGVRHSGRITGVREDGALRLENADGATHHWRGELLLPRCPVRAKATD